MTAEEAIRAVELERAILRGLCRQSRRDATFIAAIRSLHGHRWQYDEHRVVFEALERTRSVHLAPLREQLAAHATRMGFPEVAWELYFAENVSATARDAAALETSIRQLKALVQI